MIAVASLYTMFSLGGEEGERSLDLRSKRKKKHVSVSGSWVLKTLVTTNAKLLPEHRKMGRQKERWRKGSALKRRRLRCFSTVPKGFRGGERSSGAVGLGGGRDVDEEGKKNRKGEGSLHNRGVWGGLNAGRISLRLPTDKRRGGKGHAVLRLWTNSH